jgi:2-iminobutanoate/2-iminopropanoate deaminase
MSKTLQIIDPKGVARADSYSHVSRAGDFIYVAGQIAKDEHGNWVGVGDAGAQARQVYKNIGLCLASVGATAKDVVKINTMMTDRAHRFAVQEARFAFFGDHRPPHTGIITSMGSPEVMVEVEVIAYLPQGKS